MFQKLHTKIKRKCSGKLTGGMNLLHVSACPIVAQGVQDHLMPCDGGNQVSRLQSGPLTMQF